MCEVDLQMNPGHGRHRRMIVVIFTWVLLASYPTASEYRYAVGAGAGAVSLTGGDFFSFGTETSVDFALGHRLSAGWQLDLSHSSFVLTNDRAAGLTDSAGGLYNNSPLEFRATRLGVLFDRKLFDPERFLNLTLGVGGGLMVWRAIDPASNTTYVIRGGHDETTDFSATELFLTGSTGILVRPGSRFSLHLTGRVDYFTGAGAEFEPAVKDVRDRFAPSVGARLYFHFGSVADPGDWRSQEAWTRPSAEAAEPRRPRRDSDGDGIEDRLDSCLNTPRGAEVDGQGCPLDGDFDGVPNGLDDCPGTPAVARHTVDIHGCPVDSDYDGLPDFADSCAFNPAGAVVDREGCPIDSDGDGVPDGLDDCPYTLVGVEVDKHGCIDLSMLSRPMVLNIAYAPGSFEVDPHNRTRVERLAGLLNFVKDIKLDINGYTDNVGTTAANRALSEKRANRVQGILVSLGVEPERIKVFGQGETNFVASNQTAEGRAENRRIEIVFYK